MNNSSIFRLAIVALLACVLCGARVSAQEKPPVGENAAPVESRAVPTTPAPNKPVADSKMPDISGKWRNRKDLNSADIVIRRAEDGSGDFMFEKRADRIIPTAPIKWSQETLRFEQLMFDAKQKDPAKRTLQLLADGKTLRVTMLLDEALQKELIKNGSITEAEQYELLNQEWIRPEPPVEAPTPTKAGRAESEAEEPVDPLKPARIGLQPATRLAKQMVEFFGPRGAKVLEYEEGKLLKMEAPREVMDDFAKLLELVGQEHRKQAKPGPKPAAENSYSVGLEPATPLAKSLVELFGPRGAKVLEFEAGKRLKVEAPGDVFLDLEKMLRLVANETQKQAELRRTLGLAQPGSAKQAKAVSSAKRLVEQLQAQESAAAAEAATIRQLQANGQAEQNQPPIAEHQRKLKNLLSTAFDLKLQWEELQVKELQSRLSRLERQIGQRKELREKIIARRAGELIEGDTLKWDSTGAASESAAETTSKSKPTSSTTKPVASSEMTTQVHFTGPKGMEVLIADEPQALIAPVRHSFLRHASETQRYDIGFRKAPGFPDFQFVALLDIYPSTPETHRFAASPLPATDEFLRHNTVPITITEADTRHASSELLIKVVYLKTPSSVKTAIPEIEMLTSMSISPGGDVIKAANQFGTILAVLRLAQNVDQLGKLDPKSSNAAITRPRRPKLRNATHQVTIDFPIANFPVIPGDRIEVQHVLHAEEGFHGPTKTIASGLEVVGVARSLSLPTRTALTLATTPEVAMMLEHSATTGLLFCHPLDPVAMLPCGRAVRIPLATPQKGRLTVGDLVSVERMSFVTGEGNLAESPPKGIVTGLLIGFANDELEGATEPKTILTLLLPTNSDIDAHVFQENLDRLVREGMQFRGKTQERGDATPYHTAVAEIEWQIESLEKRIAYYQAHVFDNAALEKDQRNLADQHIRLHRLKYQRGLYNTSSEVMARVRPLNSATDGSQPQQ